MANRPSKSLENVWFFLANLRPGNKGKSADFQARPE
jgi:hypothetical protein